MIAGIEPKGEAVDINRRPTIGAPITAIGVRQLLTVTDIGAAAAQSSRFYSVVALAQ